MGEFRVPDAEADVCRGERNRKGGKREPAPSGMAVGHCSCSGGCGMQMRCGRAAVTTPDSEWTVQNTQIPFGVDVAKFWAAGRPVRGRACLRRCGQKSAIQAADRCKSSHSEFVSFFSATETCRSSERARYNVLLCGRRRMFSRGLE